MASAVAYGQYGRDMGDALSFNHKMSIITGTPYYFDHGAEVWDTRA